MKTAISTLFVALVLMNVMGYYGLLVGLQYRNSMLFSERVAAGDYQHSETRTLKIPMPGHAGSEEYTSIAGEFEKQGQVYRLIKQRLYKDTFHIVVIKDEVGTLIKHALKDYAKTFSDQSDDDSNELIILPIFIREYVNSSELIAVSLFGIGDSACNSTPKVFLDQFSHKIIQPPQNA